MFDIFDFQGFEWDNGNINKNFIKHKVANVECEEIFFNQPLLINNDIAHSVNEDRLFALGKTNKNRYLFIVFTVRKNLIRIISARDMTSKERRRYLS